MIRKKSLAKAMALTLSVSMLGTSMPGSVSTAAELKETETEAQSETDSSSEDAKEAADAPEEDAEADEGDASDDKSKKTIRNLLIIRSQRNPRLQLRQKRLK